MTRGVLGLLAAGLLAAPAWGQPATPDAVVKKAIEAHGGAAALGKYPAGVSNMKGTFLRGTEEVPFTGTIAFAVPGKVKLDLTLSLDGRKPTMSQVVNGDKVRYLVDGKPAPLSEVLKDEVRQTPLIQEMSLLVPLLDAKRFTLSAEKDEAVGGKPASVVGVKAKGLNDTKLYFDKAAGTLVKVRRKALDLETKEVVEETTFSDYQKVAGLLVPMKSAVTHDGKPFMTATVSEFKPLEAIDAKEFAVPE